VAPLAEAHRKIGRTSLGDRMEGRNQAEARGRTWARPDKRRHISGSHPLNPASFKPQPLRYTGKWNTNNGLHGEKALKMAADQKAAKQAKKALKATSRATTQAAAAPKPAA